MNYKIIKFFIITFLMVLVVISCGESYKEKIEKEQIENNNQIELYNKQLNSLIEPLKNRYNPKEFPPEIFKNRIILTYNLKKYLIDENKTPISFRGILTDITQDKDNQFFLHFVSLLSINYPSDERIKFQLSCNYNDIKDIVETPPEKDFFGTKYFIPNYYVVCEVFSIDKIYFFEITGSKEDQETVQVEIETPHTYSVKGKLIDFIKYPKE